MEADVAVTQPSAWIVSVEGDDNVTGGWQDSSISARRVDQIQGCVCRELGFIGAEDEEVMSVKMNWVGEGEGLFDHKVDPLVRGRELEDGGLVGEGGFIVKDLQESWVSPRSQHGLLAERPAEVQVGVETQPDGKVIFLRDVADVDGEGGNEHSVVNLAAVLESVGRGVWRSTAAGIIANDATNTIRVGISSASGLRDSAEPEIARSFSGIDYNVISLAVGDDERLNIIGLDSHQVVSDDGHIVVIDRDTESSVDGCIDEAKTMLFPSSQNSLEVLAGAIAADHSSVDEARQLGWGAHSLSGVKETGLGNVGPILETDSTQVDVIVG